MIEPKNLYIAPPDIPDAYLGIYDELGPDIGGGMRLHWGRLDNQRARMPQMGMAAISDAGPAAKKARRKKMR